MSGRHRLNPFERDMNGDWDGVVKFSNKTGQLIRFSDRNGEHWEPVGSMIPANFIADAEVAYE